MALGAQRLYRARRSRETTTPSPPEPVPASLGSPESNFRPRIQALSDLVFGLALSLGALILVNLPLGNPYQFYVSLLLFGFSFLIIITVWYRYASIMVTLPLDTMRLVILNLVLLFTVAIEPYLLYVLAYHIPEPVGESASVLYAIDLAGMNAILGGFLHALARERRPLVPPQELRKMRIRRNFTLVSAVIFLITALPVFWTWMWIPGIPSRVLLWLLILPAVGAIRFLNR